MSENTYKGERNPWPRFISAALFAGGLVLGASGPGKAIVSSVFPQTAEAATPKKAAYQADDSRMSRASFESAQDFTRLSSKQESIIDSFTGLTPEQQTFLRVAVPAAQQLQAEGVPINPADMIAQAIVESDWGRQVAGNNLFGIKADPNWRGATVTVPTTEYIDGVRQTVPGTFRAYDSYYGSFTDYANMITSEKWAQDATANANNARAYMEGLQNGGPDNSYATAPNYTDIVLSVVQDFHLVELTSL